MFVCYWGHEGARSPSSNTIHWPYNVSSTRNRSIVFISWFSWRLFGLIQSLDGWLDLCLDRDFSFISIMNVGLSCFSSYDFLLTCPEMSPCYVCMTWCLQMDLLNCLVKFHPHLQQIWWQLSFSSMVFFQSKSNHSILMCPWEGYYMNEFACDG